ncbi:MAG: hypothetical protein IT178_06080 [Acidobacteria bacterium]|nr:hypothetical protein [Acidobacteriota bacterium]
MTAICVAPPVGAPEMSALQSLSPSPAARTYRRILANFDPREVERSVAALDGLSPAAVEEALDAVARQLEHPDRRLALMLHLETAIAVAPQRPDTAMQHLRWGERLFAAAAPSFKTADGDIFEDRWFVVAASIMLAQTDVDRARAAIARGLARQPTSARLTMLRGVTYEMDAAYFDADYVADAPTRWSVERERTLRLMSAEDAYRRAIEREAEFVPARIRLGRVLDQQQKHVEAKATLTDALSRATAPSDRYLALLFLSAMLEREGDIDGARAKLEEATALIPARQTAWLAMAQLQDRTGNPAAAADSLRHAIAAVTTESWDEWWGYRNGTLEFGALEWLRAQVRQ